MATDRTWIDSEATDQLARIAALPGARRAAGMPDLHAGAGAPIGAALLADRVYPHLVGSDIGCGVAVWPLPDLRRAAPEKIAKRLDGLDTVAAGELPNDWAIRFGAPHHETLGTIGGGNHFLEVCAVDEAFDPEIAQANGLEPGALVVMIHTGSRGLGREVLSEHIETHGPVACTAEQLPEYLRRHDEAVRFGHANRAALALRVADRLHVDLDPMNPLIDLCHNNVEPIGDDWLHRKGAAPNVPGTTGLAALPGSRGARSHVVTPTDDTAAIERALWSVAHGAGRKHSRTTARSRYSRTPRRELTTTSFGSRVICDDAALLAEEAPGAYKDIEDVIEALVAARLVRPVAALRPVATFKTQAARERRSRDRAEKERDRDRRSRR